MQSSGTPQRNQPVKRSVVLPMSLLAMVVLITGCPGPNTPAPSANEVIPPASIAGAPGFGHGNRRPASPHGAPPPTAPHSGAEQAKPDTPAASATPDTPATDATPNEQAAPKPDEGLAKLARAGKRVWSRYQCYTCHRVNGRGGSNGPDLTGVGTKYTTIKGSPDKARAWFHLHLADPQQYPGTDHQSYFVKMPKFPFSEKERDELVEYLMKLQ